MMPRFASASSAPWPVSSQTFRVTATQSPPTLDVIPERRLCGTQIEKLSLVFSCGDRMVIVVGPSHKGGRNRQNPFPVTARIQVANPTSGSKEQDPVLCAANAIVASV